MLPPDRRSFLARLSGALALLTTGTTDIVASESNGKRPSVRQPVRPSEWDDSWLEGLTTGHKQIFDIPGHLNGGALFYCNNYLRGLEASGIPTGDIQAVLGLHGSAIPLALTDPLWARYKLGEMFRINDPRTKTASVRNLWLAAIRKQGAGSRKQGAASRKQGAGSREQEARSRKQEAGIRTEVERLCPAACSLLPAPAPEVLVSIPIASVGFGLKEVLIGESK